MTTYSLRPEGEVAGAAFEMGAVPEQSRAREAVDDCCACCPEVVEGRL